MRLKQLLGEIMIGMGFVTRQQVDEALQRQIKIFEEKTVPERLQRARLVSQARLATDRILLLGQILTDMGFATKEQLEEALKEQNKIVEVYKSLESEKLGTTIETGFIVNSTLDLAQVLALIMGHANRVTNSIASTLMLLDDKTGELVFSVPTGPKGDRLTDIRLPSGKGIAGWVAEHEEPALVPDAREDPRFYPEIDKISGFETKSILCVPLKAKTKLIGVLEAINKADGTSFTEEDTLLLNIFAYQAAMAIENARLYGELKDRLEEQILMQKKLAENITERKQVEEELRRSNEELLKEHNQRMMLSKSLIDLLEKDRRQIAMELHDHIGQTLTSLKMNLEMIHGKLKPGHTELGAQITVAQERAIQAIKDVKNISHGLRPAMIEALGVVSSLRGLLNEIQQQTDIEIRFFSRGIPKRFEEEKELAIYRIAQEALGNIIRHAQAKNVFVNLVKKDEKLSLSVEDDGVGFDQDKVMKISKKKGPLGLLIMRERAVQLDGEFTIESQPGKGTHLLVEIPL